MLMILVECPSDLPVPKRAVLCHAAMTSHCYDVMLLWCHAAMISRICSWYWFRLKSTVLIRLMRCNLSAWFLMTIHFWFWWNNRGSKMLPRSHEGLILCKQFLLVWGMFSWFSMYRARMCLSGCMTHAHTRSDTDTTPDLAGGKVSLSVVG